MKTSSPQAPQRTEQSSRKEQSPRSQPPSQTESATSRDGSSTQQAQQIRDSVAHDEIARRAHELWEQDGRQDGRDQEHWIEAEKQLRGSSFKAAAEAETGDGDAHAQARAIKASAERRESKQARN